MVRAHVGRRHHYEEGQECNARLRVSIVLRTATLAAADDRPGAPTDDQSEGILAVVMGKIGDLPEDVQPIAPLINAAVAANGVAKAKDAMQKAKDGWII